MTGVQTCALPISGLFGVAAAGDEVHHGPPGPELVVRLALAPGLSRAELDGVLARLQAAWSASEVIAQRVDSLRVQLVASE